MNLWEKKHQLSDVKPTRFEAIQLTHENVEEVAAWCRGFPVEEIDPVDSTIRYVGINFESMGGMIRASEGVVIQKGGDGMFFLNDPDDWHRRMKQVDGDQPDMTTQTNDPFEGMNRA